MRQSYLYLLIVFIAFGCATGKKAFEKGDYDKAVYQAVNRLKSNSDSKKALATLEKAYNLAVNTHLENIKRYEVSLDPLKNEWIIQEYNSINSLYDAIRGCPACSREISKPVYFTKKLNDAKMNAAEVRYTMGLEAMKYKENRNQAIEAHQNFRKANDYVRGYQDVENLIEEALYFATLRVVIEEIPSPARIYDLNQEFFYNKVSEYLHRNNINPYVRFYTPDEARSYENDWVDHVINMRFNRFNLGNLVSNTYVEEVSRDSVVIATRDGEDIYGTVKAKLKINERSILGSGELDFKIRDINTNKVISQDRFPSEYRWTIRWATFNGDERALNDEQKDLVNTVEVSAPGPQRMFEEFAAPIYNQLISKLENYYRNY